MHRFVIFVLFALLASGDAFAQNADEKFLKKQTLKKVKKNIDLNVKKGYIPMDIAITGKGRFSVRMEKPFQDFLWEAEFELTDDQFETHFKKNHARQLRLVDHEEYEFKKKKLHACVWHYDKSLAPLSEKDLKNPDKRPPSQPLGMIWQPGAIIPAVGLQGGPYADFEKRVAEYMTATQMPAISVAFSVKGQPVYQASFGFADIQRMKTVTPENTFRTVWMSQLITAIATLQLVDQGKLKLDEPVYPLLGIKPWKKDKLDSRLDKITIKQLLQMTGGHDAKLTKDPIFNSRHVAKEMKITDEVTPEQAIQYMMSQPLGYEPGTKRKISHYGYFLLGQVIGKVSGMSYEDYVLENVAKPAKMGSLVMTQVDESQRPESSVRHYARGGHFFQAITGKDFGKWSSADEGVMHYGLLNSSYGWLSTPMDMLALGHALQSNPSPFLSNEMKEILVSMPDFEAKLATTAKPTTWDGMGLRVRVLKNGNMDFWMESRGTYSTNSVVCFASGDTRCFMMSCTETADGSSTYGSFAPIASEGFKVAVRLHRK